MAVAAVVDAVPSAGHSRSGGDGADVGRLGEGGFAADAFGVVAGDDEDLCGGVDADAELLEQLWRGLGDEPFDHG